jgi:monoamine oxidase
VRTLRYRWNDEDLAVDSGMEEYWESNPAVEYLMALNLPHRSDVAMSSMRLQGKLYTLGAADLDMDTYMQRLFTAKERAALKRFKEEVAPTVHKIVAYQRENDGDTLLPPELLSLKDVSFEEYVNERVKLPAKVADWIRVSIECEIGTEWDKISALDGLSEFHIFLGKDGKGELSYRVTGGNDAFALGLAQEVGWKRILTNQRVTAVRRLGNRSLVQVMDATTNRQMIYEAKHVVSTVPPYRIVMEVQFDPPMSHQKLASIKSQTYGSYFKAHIFLPKEAERFWTDKDGESALPILSDSELGVIYDGNPDYAGKTKILSLLIHGAKAESFNFMPLDLVRQIIKESLDQQWPGIKAEVLNMEFYRYHPRAIAAWPVGRSRFDELSQELRKPENGIYFAGDFTESSHSDGSIMSAHRVVRQILKAESAKTAGRKPNPMAGAGL